MRVFQHAPGLAGLFVAALFSGALRFVPLDTQCSVVSIEKVGCKGNVFCFDINVGCTTKTRLYVSTIYFELLMSYSNKNNNNSNRMTST